MHLLFLAMDNNTVELQRMSMTLLLRHDLHPQYLAGIIVQEPNDLYDICSWTGVECENGLVTQISWTHMQDPVIHTIKWLPATLHRVSIDSIKLSEPLETRRLPRELRRCNFYACRLAGLLQLHLLPNSIEELSLCFNRFAGAISLTGLPISLMTIDVSNNLLNKVFVGNANLHQGLLYGRFYQPDKSVRFVCIDSTEVDARIHRRWQTPPNLDVLLENPDWIPEYSRDNDLDPPNVDVYGIGDVAKNVISNVI